MMLQKIHGARPSINKADIVKHAKKAKYLKKMVSDGSKRQSIIQAARQMIISQELPRRLHQHSLKWGNRIDNSSNRRYKSPKVENGPSEVV